MTVTAEDSGNEENDDSCDDGVEVDGHNQDYGDNVHEENHKMPQKAMWTENSRFFSKETVVLHWWESKAEKFATSS